MTNGGRSILHEISKIETTVFDIVKVSCWKLHLIFGLRLLGKNLLERTVREL